MTSLWAFAAQKASELRMIKTQWCGDPSSICGGLGALVPWGAAEVGTSGLSLGAVSRAGSHSSTKPSLGHALHLSQHRLGCGWKWWFFSSPNAWEYERLRLVTIF